MAWTYAPMEAIIPNTTMTGGYLDGVFRVYCIYPNDGYVMHDSSYDVPVLNEETYELTGDIILGYRTTEARVGYNYDFAPVETHDELGDAVIGYGSKLFFCKPIDEVPADQIFGVTNPPEIM